jgi:hypothetical protein
MMKRIIVILLKIVIEDNSYNRNRVNTKIPPKLLEITISQEIINIINTKIE